MLVRLYLCFVRPAARRRRFLRFRPWLEILEPRAVPAMLAPGSGSEIHGFVFDDRNGDGLRGPDQAGIAAVKVFLDLNHDGALDTGDVYTSTAADGSYAFTGLAPDTYSVVQVLPIGRRQIS